MLFAAHAAPPSQAPSAITPDGGQYWGPLINGMFQGTGHIEWRNGASYSGTFETGQLSGKGRFQTPTGDVYDGDFKEGLPSGNIILTTRSGAIYKGEVQLGLLDGKGHLQDKRNIYEGEFKNNLYHGQGYLQSPEHTYTGEFREGFFWGTGTLHQKSGAIYQGEFVQGEFHGKGRYTVANGPVFDGDFEEGKFQGIGLITYPSGAKQEGSFRGWRPEGSGTFTDPEKNIFQGIFKGGQLVGPVTVHRVDRTKYVGELQNWMPHGQGELLHANGDVYRGKFSYGLYQGEGTLTYAKPQEDGRTQDTGIWEYGRLKKHIEEEQRRAKNNLEHALYTQADTLNRALEKVRSNPEDAIKLYFLGIAGDGTQEVFRREVDFVQAQFNSRYGTVNHSLSLINSRNTVDFQPLATVTSIRKAVSSIASKMNVEQDILFLFLTSHGSKEGNLSLQMEGASFPELTATELASILKISKIRWKVVVISACYAGSFIDALKDPGTMIITAARADRRSFGCADENDFTYFGRAFFKESLPNSNSFEDAYKKATILIKNWETENIQKEHIETGETTETKVTLNELYSSPQLDAPEPIRKHLRSWSNQLQYIRKITSHTQ